MRHLSVLLVFAMACGTPVKGMTELVDAMIDSPDSHDEPDIDAPDASPPPPPRRGGVASTSGGGVTTSAQHRMRVRIGAPQPMGKANSTGHRITTGPGALP